MKNGDKNRRRTVGQIFLPWAGFALLLTGWAVVAAVGNLPEYFLPSPLQVLTTFMEQIQDPQFQLHVGASLRRVLIGFVLSMVVGIPLGMGIGLVRPIRAAISPLIDAIRYTPVVAFIPLLVLWFGIGDTQKYLVILMGTGPYLAILVADAVSNVRREFIDTALTLGASPRHLLFGVILPYSLPGIWDALRVSLGIAWIYLLTAELVGANLGLGHFIMRSQRFLQTTNILMSVMLIGVIGLLSDYAFKYTYQRFFRWFTLSIQRD